MYRIPNTEKRFIQDNISDVGKSLWYTKNIDLDEKGYLKLSSRAVSFLSTDEDSHFGYPYSIGRKSLNGDLFLATSDYTFHVVIDGTGITVTNDGLSSNIPVGSVNNRGKWWQNKFHVTTDTSMKSRDGVTNTWASTGISLTTGKLHPLEVFTNRTSMVIGNGNVVKQYDTSYANTIDLTLPVEFEVVGLSYQDQQVGVATRLNPLVAGQNIEAIFAIWDGAGIGANKIFPVGSDAIIQVVAYKSSWALLTRNGKLLYFNGGGFDVLATLPFFFKKYNVDNTTMLGDIMTVDGDLVYLNIPADILYFGLLQQRFMQNFNGGILCFDPNVGLYSRYSPSLSKAYSIQSGSANIDTTTDIITATSGTLPDTGNPIIYTNDPSNPIGGLMLGSVYYIIKLTTTTFKLATTKANALAGEWIDLTSAGASSATFIGVQIVDYGQSKATVTNAVALMGSQSYDYNHLMFGGYYTDFNTTTPYRNMCITVPQFPNIGYAVTDKFELALEQQTGVPTIEEEIPEIYVKYRPLKDGDKIVLKYKNKDVLGLPVTSGQRGKSCSWTGTRIFTTTADLSAVQTYLDADDENECECEIIEGAAAGQMSQIESITYLAGTYTVTLEDDLDGATSGNSCNVIIDSWHILMTADGESELTVLNTKGWAEFPLAKEAKWHKVKTILYGVETCIEEQTSINVPAISGV